MHDYAQYPSAAVTRTGDAAQPARDFWLHLQPMHFMAGLDRLTAMVAARRERASSRAELAELEPTIGAHLRAAGMQLVTTSQDDWLVHSERALDVQTVTPESGGRESARAGDAAGSRCAGAAPAHDGAADAAA